MKLLSRILTLCLLLVGSSATSFGDLVIAYRFDGSVDTSSDTNIDSVASSFVFTSGLTGGNPLIPSPGFSVNVPTGGGTNSRFTRTYVTANTAAGAIAANDYAEFSVNANPGFQLNLNSFSMNLGSNGVNANGAGDPTTSNTSSFALRSSLDGYSTTIGTLSVTAPNGTTVWTSGSINLSGATYQGLSGIGFRLYMYDTFDSTTPSGFTGVNRMDNIFLDATVTAVPEPTSLALGGIASLLIIARRGCRARIAIS
jgi:hypothetical protein